MASSRATIVRCAVPIVAMISAAFGVACSSDKDPAKSSEPLTLADGAITDADAEEIGDGWYSSDGGSVDTGSADAGPLCPGQQGAALNTFLGANSYIQIDRDPNGPTDPGTEGFGANANLVLGDDPATNPGSPSFNLPAAYTSTTPSFIDWQSLASSPYTLGNHQLQDVFSGKDPSAFPGNSSCVGSANNPSKDELLEAGIGNNNDYVYLNVLRASGLGDMGYMWLFTKEKPTCSVEGQCDNFLRYPIKQGDVLIFGHFRNSGARLLSVYRAKFDAAPPYYPAQLAINCLDSIWEDVTDGIPVDGGVPLPAVGGVAINTDLTKAGSWNSTVKSPKTGADGQPAFEEFIFAEAAVRTDTFGTGGVCGQTFWASVISKSSGNVCAAADVKDLIGPRKVNFGSVAVTAHVKPNCDGTVDLQATISSTGTASCKWYDGDPTVEANKIFESATCDAIVGVPLSAGSHNISVKVSETSGCTATSAAVAVTTAAAPTATCTLTPTCTTSDNLGYSVTGTGQGTLSYSWTLTNSSATVGLPQPTGASGSVTVAPVGASILYTASAEVTDSRGCKATCAQVTATPLAPITVTLANPLPTDRVCVAPYASFADDVTFAATGVTGGTGNYAYTWTVLGCTNPADNTTCTASACSSNPTVSQCTIDPDGTDTCIYKKISVSVDDTGTGSALCAAAAAGPRTYHKTTKIDVE